MRKCRVIENCRCYHLIGRDDILRRINVLYRDASLSRVFGEWTRLKGEDGKILEHARATEKYVSRFGECRKSFVRLMWNLSEFMRTFKQHFSMSFNGRRVVWRQSRPTQVQG